MGREETVRRIVKTAKKADKGMYIGAIFFPGGKGEIFTSEKHINRICKIGR
ncbi:hypothetical protein KAT95_01075 [Candidatus Parcubacteria bacterium]|nr:hypothetical protein [Candidatus Parcubacteria bacterium]